MQAQIQAQSIQISTNAFPTYAAVARIPSTDHPSNLRSISNTMLSTMIDTLYSTIDMSRITEEKKNRRYPKTIKEAIKNKI